MIRGGSQPTTGDGIHVYGFGGLPQCRGAVGDATGERALAVQINTVVGPGSTANNVIQKHRLKAVEEVAQIFCATSNPVTILVADTGKGRGVMGVVDGVSPKGVEGAQDKEERRAFLRKIGYKR